MPANEDLLPAGTGLILYPSNPYTFTLTWPSSIAGRTFTATLGATALSPTVSGTDLTIPLTAPATEGRTTLEVTETTGDDVVLFRFPVQVSEASGSRAGSVDLTVTDGSVSIDVTVLAGSNFPTARGRRTTTRCSDCRRATAPWSRSRNARWTAWSGCGAISSPTPRR